MPPAIAAAGIGAAASIGGSILGGNAQKKAANQAANISEQNNKRNVELAREIYGQNAARLDPYASNGLVAGNAIMELLGFGGPQQVNALTGYPQQMPAPVAPPGASTVPYGAAGQHEIDDYSRFPMGRPGLPVNTPMPAGTPTQMIPNAPAGGNVTVQPPRQSAMSAFDRYRESDGYNFRLGEGFNALNTGYAARGMLESGAAQKGLLRYGQDYGSNEFGKYIGYLSNQQGVGLSGASALAGVGQNYVNSVTAGNTANANNAANAALVAGNAQGQMWGGIANGLGGLAGSLGSSFGGGGTNAPWNGSVNFNGFVPPRW